MVKVHKLVLKFKGGKKAMNRKLYCSPDKKLLGVCGGIADYMNVDPTVVRIIVALVAIYTTGVPVLLIYLIAGLIIPKAPENYYQMFNNTAPRITKGHSKMVAGVCSGFAEKFGCDTTIVRLVFVLLVLLAGTGLVAYITCAIIMPQPNDNYYNQNGYNPNNNGFNN